VVLVAAELVGSMASALAETVDYVAQRQQFGRAIGSFQAVKHQCADMFVALEQARALVQSAAITVHEQSATAARDVSAVAAWVPSAAIDNAAKAVHLHGGMGYAWETGLHLHVRRAVAVHRLVGERRPNASAVLADLVRCTPQQVPA
jgi:alkylation response protein AidB-like acyl-CoA dehydrogenase